MKEFERTCDECGKAYTARHPRSRYCSTPCRVRVSKRPSKIPAALGEKAAEVKPEAPLYDTLAETVRHQLAEIEALGTISGVAAIRVAQQIDRGRDTGSAVATLTRELSRLIEEAKAEAAPRIRDAVTDLQADVATKLRAVG